MLGLPFLDREDEIARLEALHQAGGLGVVTGRRRIGKTRLLVEWVKREEGVYSVADESAPAVQREHLARALAERFEGFSDVTYPSWQALFDRVIAESQNAQWRGPLVLDELPYLMAHSPELPSVLQRLVDHSLPKLGMTWVVAGSSQRMMQGLVLDANAPLFGRASQSMQLGPLPPGYLSAALGAADAAERIGQYTAWGGVPRYWELAARHGGDTLSALHDLVLTPNGVLHNEPTRLLLEEQPPAAEVRPLLDAIGAGAHRVSEIAARIGRPATSLSRPLERLQELGLVAREVPFGEPPRKSKRALYRIADPFTRMWFRVVAANRAALAAGSEASRRNLVKKHWNGLCSAAWEELARALVPRLNIGGLPTFGVASRWWRGNDPEWDLVASELDGRGLLLGEVKFSERAFDTDAVDTLCRQLANRAPPPGVEANHDVQRCLFVPDTESRLRSRHGVHIITARKVFSR